jgi:hypothetical protein
VSAVAERHLSALGISAIISEQFLNMTQAQYYYLFGLPEALLDSLSVRKLGFLNENVAVKQEEEDQEEATSRPRAIGPKSCNVCPGAAHVSVQDQRDHFKSDWHRYNVKIRLNNGRTASESEFASLVDGT